MTLKGVTLKSGDRAENVNSLWICPLPDGHEQVKEVWARLLFQNEDYRRKYLVRHAVGTNSVDSTFQLQPSVWSFLGMRPRSQAGPSRWMTSPTEA